MNRKDNESINPDNEDQTTSQIHRKSTLRLILFIRQQIAALIVKEAALIKTELRADLATSASTASWIGAGVATGLISLTLLLVTIIFTLSLYMPGWVAALLVSGFMMIVSGFALITGWRKRVRDPFVRVKETLNHTISLNTGKNNEQRAA